MTTYTIAYDAELVGAALQACVPDGDTAALAEALALQDLTLADVEVVTGLTLTDTAPENGTVVWRGDQTSGWLMDDEGTPWEYAVLMPDPGENRSALGDAR